MPEKETRHVHVILWHPDGQRVAVQNGKWPTILLRQGENAAQAVQDAWKLESWMLDDAGTSFGLEGMPRLRALTDDLPPGLEWQRKEVPPLPFPRPWQRPDWPEAMQERLAHAGWGRAELKLVHSNDLACIVEVRRDGKTAFFKCSNSGHEMRNTLYAAEHFPHLTPPLLAVNEQENWQLIASGGSLLDSVGEFPAWQQAIERLAEFQRRADATALAQLGTSAFPLAEMSKQVAVFLSDTTLLKSWGLSDEKIAALQTARPAIASAFEAVRALNLPDLPAHGDAHPRNALHGERGSVWFDWSEVSHAAHPLMDFGWFLGFVLHPAREQLALRQAEPQLEGKLIRAVVDALNLPASAASLVSAALPLAYLHRAVVYDRNFRHWQGNIPGWRPNYVPFYLNQALQELPRLTA